MRRSSLPRPMLATASSADAIMHLADLDQWAFEMKWDGFRIIAGVDAEGVVLMSRNGDDVTATYPEVADAVAALHGPLVLDGEVVAYDAKGRPSFQLLQQRSGLTAARDVDRARRAVRVVYLVFDLLRTPDGDLLDAPYDERRAVLARLVTASPALQVPPAAHGDFEQAFRTSAELGLEGVVAKQRSGTYRPGTRTKGWLKAKHRRMQEVIVIGWRSGRGARASTVGSLLVAVPDAGGELHYAGRVGTGFSEKSLTDMTRRFASMAVDDAPAGDVPQADARDAHWIEPRLVAEVEFQEWTGDDRLRQPSWRGWRPDKSAADIIRE